MNVMIGVKVKDCELWLPRFLNQLDNLTDPVNRIVFMYGKSHDKTYAILQHWRHTTKHCVEVYHDPYLTIGERHGYSLAKIKQDLQRIFLAGKEDYLLSLDCDIVKFPTNLISALISCDVDVVAPMVWTENRAVPTFFDTYEYRKDGGMFHAYKPPGLNASEKFPVDSVGTCVLKTREAEQKGKYSNPYPNIPFCKSLKNQGYQIWVNPAVNVVHVDLEHYGILHYPLNHPYSNVGYITNENEKLTGEQVQAERFDHDRQAYDAWFKKTYPKDYKAVQDQSSTRPLITACYKVFNEASFLPYSLQSIYPYVDRIDILEGAIKELQHIANSDGSSTDGTVQIIKDFPDPQHKIRLIQGKWHNREEMQTKLLEICDSKWILFIDGDEVSDPQSMRSMRRFCELNQDGQKVYARPTRFLNFWHDFKHIAYSLNPLSPWAQYGLPHAFLIWRDIPGLNFTAIHTIPVDGFGIPVSLDYPGYRKHQTVLDNVFMYHFGNAKGTEAMKAKLLTGHARLLGDTAKEDPWFSGEMPADMVIEEFTGKLPVLLRKHPEYGKQQIQITETKPTYKFKRLADDA
jgi:hypothetical protein